MLGAAYAATTQDPLVGQLLSALLSVAVVLLVFLIARHLFDELTGVIAAALVAVLPVFSIWSLALLTEPLFLTLVLAAVGAVLLARGPEHPTRWAITAGVLCGLAILTRSNGVVLLLPAVLGVWTVRPRFSRRALRLPAFLLVATLLTVAPWAVRNAVVFDGPAPLNTQSGYGLIGTYNDAARSDPDQPASWLAPQFFGPHQAYFRRDDLSELELDRELRGEAVDYALANPTYVPKVVALNTLRLLDLLPARGSLSYPSGGLTLDRWESRAIRASGFALLLAAAVGALLLWRRPALRVPGFIWLVPLLTALASVPVAGGPRYRAPADPFLAILAAVALAAAWTARGQLPATVRRRGGRAPAGGRTPAAGS